MTLFEPERADRLASRFGYRPADPLNEQPDACLMERYCQVALPDVFSESPMELELELTRDFGHLRSLVLAHVLFESLDELVAQVNPLKHLEELELRHVYIKISHPGLPRTWSPSRHADAVAWLPPRLHV